LALVIARPSTLEERVRAILSPRINRREVTAATVAIALIAAIALSVPLAAMQKVYKVTDEGVTAPKLLSKVEPQYSEAARDAKIDGVCILTLEVDTDGLARNIKVKKSLHPDLDANAILAIEQWRFKPAEKDGKPVIVSANVEVNFKLK